MNQLRGQDQEDMKLTVCQTLTVLNPMARIDNHIMDDADLAGPFLFCALFGTFLLLVRPLPPSCPVSTLTLSSSPASSGSATSAASQSSAPSPSTSSSP